MWTTESAKLERAVCISVKSYTSRTYWVHPHVASYGPKLDIDPLLFLFAVERTSITASAMDAQSKHTSKLLGDVAMAFINYMPNGNPALPGTLHLHPNLSTTKDFVGTSVKGIIGAAMGYLEMQNLGYSWQGHWEDCILSGGKGPQPDFIFAKSTDVCIVDAKGSTSSQVHLIKRVKDEWARQIRPNLGVTLAGGGWPTEGRVIGTRLHLVNAAEIVTAYGKVRSSTPTSASVAKLAPSSAPVAANFGAAAEPNTQRLLAGVAAVQRINYATACNLIGLPAIGQQLLNLNGFADRRQRDVTLDYLNLTPDSVSSGRVFGQSHMRYLGDGSVWKLTPFIEESTLHMVVRKFIGAVDLSLPSNAAGIRVTKGEIFTTIESADGVGIQFQLISQIDAQSPTKNE